MTATRPAPSLQPRKTPVQERSIATVEAIYDATIQVLLRCGIERLTTLRVAKRAGVSVGTLYQYYPNKRSLLFAVLERRLTQVTKALERACEENHHRPLRVMVEAVVHAFVDAKLAERDVSVALYRIAAGLDGERIVAKLGRRSQTAIAAMLRTTTEVPAAEIDFVAFTFLAALAGATRAVLDQGAPTAMAQKLGHHLTLLGYGYMKKTTTAKF